jgi:hypothetical protein
MSRTFYPETNIMPVGGRYRPLFRLMADENWRMVRKGKEIVDYPTAHEARRAARDCLEAVLNPPLRSEVMTEPEADILGIEEWRQRREDEASEERRQTFGDEVAKTLFIKGRVVEVERRKRA